jgi:peptidoglycan/LPS O-acetylase OafA/YrhL
MLKPLTSLRFFFALMVFLHHLEFLKDRDNDTLNWLINNIFKEGYIGVSFFFILSGFILSFNYKTKLSEQSIPIKNFLIARIARIYPIHIITLLVAFPFTFSTLLKDWSKWFFQLFLNLTLTQSFIPNKEYYGSFNWTAWSISTELFFYLAFPLVILFLSKKEVTIQKLSLVLAVITAILLALMTFNTLPNFKDYFYINPFIRLIDFVFGIFLYEIYIKSHPKFVKLNNATIWEVGSLILLGLFFLSHNNISQIYRYSIFYWPPILFLIFIFSFQKGLISKIISGNIFILLGEISFSFYLIHQLVIRYSRKFNLVERIDNDFAYIVILFLICLGLSYLSFQFIEKPANNFVKRRLSNKKLQAVKA